MPARITDYLVADHERLHGLLVRACGSATLDAIAFAAFRSGLIRHIAIEEKLLFPAVRLARGAPLARAHELRVDHAALTSLLVPTPDVALCGELLSLLGPHDEKEEGPTGIYAECEQALGAERSSVLAERAAVFADVRLAPHRDGPGGYRTARLALAAARRLTPVGRAPRS